MTESLAGTRGSSGARRKRLERIRQLSEQLDARWSEQAAGPALTPRRREGST